MNDEESSEIAPEDTGGEGAALSPEKGLRAFQKISRELTEEDLSQPGVQRLVIGNLDKLEMENYELRDYQRQFHEADKRVAILEEKQKTSTAFEVLSGGSLVAGSVLIGYTRYLWEDQPAGLIALGVGIILIVAGIVAKVVKR